MPSQPHREDVSLIQWNTQGISTSKEDLLNIINISKPLIISIQETFLAEDYTIKLPNYNSLCKQGHYNRRFHGGVALYIHSSCPYNPLSLDTPMQVVAATVSLIPTQPITVASIYIPGSAQFDENHFQTILDTLPKPFILMGDYNAHHTMWGDRTTDSRGRKLERILQDNNLNIINSGEGTHISGTAIDLTIASPELDPHLMWEVLPSILSSDHHPIVIKLESPARCVNNTEGYNFKRANWKGYTDDPLWQSIPNEVNNDPALAVEEIYELFTCLCQKYVPKLKVGRFFPKPWWSAECSRVWKEREKLYAAFRRTGNPEDKVKWKRARAIATRTFRDEKKKEWANYVGKLNNNATSAEIWNQVRRIRGRPPRKISILEVNGRVVSSLPDIVNELADTLADITSNERYDAEFRTFKGNAEQQQLDFLSQNDEPYNALFNLNELNDAIRQTKDNSPGPDNIHNRMFRHMPENARIYLLTIINRVWQHSYFDDRWREAVVVPIPKPGKDHKNPANYRPISLTSCMCKLIEKMINTRLINYLEMKKFFARVQCGFRKNRSTVDQLVRFETFIRTAIAEGKHVASVFFDMEKAYDKTWRYGILKDLHEFGMRGRMCLFVAEFLERRLFQVRVNGELSDLKTQETGVPQGSTLSVTLFAIKINSLYRSIPDALFCSMYVDDIQIAFAHHDRNVMRTELQNGIDQISRWVNRNGFKLSASKTIGMEFYKERAPMQQLLLSLDANVISFAATSKFLGLLWDSKLTWVPHISALKDRCKKALNLVRTVSTDKWGADTATTMKLYRSLIRPMIDYGSIVYDSASRATLGNLDVIANEAMRIATGAFKTSPASSLHVLTAEPPLQLRRKELALKYYAKIKSDILNPAFNCIHNSELRLFFASRPLAKQPFAMRAERYCSEYDIKMCPILPKITPKLMPHEIVDPSTDFDLSTFQKTVTPVNVFRGSYDSLIDRKYGMHEQIYTDGSKSEGIVGAAAVSELKRSSSSLPSVASIFTAELVGLRLALNIVEELEICDSLICSDSLSSLESLSNCNTRNELVRRLRIKLHEMTNKGFRVTLCWVPSHCGIPGNELADQAAKNAATRPPEFVPVPYTDWYPAIENKTWQIWAVLWSDEIRHLKEVIKEPRKLKVRKVMNRRDEVIINRLRLGHCKATHSYLVEEGVKPPPMCTLCGNNVLTVKHFLIECPRLKYKIKHHFNSLIVNMEELLGDNAEIGRVIEYVKDIGIYNAL